MEERDFLRLIYMQMNTKIEFIDMYNYCNGFCMIVRLFEIIYISQTLSISLPVLQWPCRISFGFVSPVGFNARGMFILSTYR